MTKLQARRAYRYYMVFFCISLFSLLLMMSGIRIGAHASSLTLAGPAMLKYFTVDSNILMCVVSLILAKKCKKIAEGLEDSLSSAMHALTLAGTTGVTLTMLVTVFFLAPTSTTGWISLFTNSNFFLHLINPLLSLIGFLFLISFPERPWKNTLWGILPMVLYSFYYVGNCLLHMVDGRIPKAYDWYGFLVLGIQSAFVVLPLMYCITYVISLSLWFLNRRKH